MCSWISHLVLLAGCVFVSHSGFTHPPTNTQHLQSQQYVVDLFGDDSPKGQRLLNHYRRALIRVEKAADEKAKKQLIKRIQQAGDYLHVHVERVHYPDTPVLYMTLEVVTKQEPERLRWVPPPRSEHDPHSQHDAIWLMQQYVQTGERLFAMNQLDAHHRGCRPHHCTFGFIHPALKPYRKRFDEAVKHEKPTILAALHDADPARRAAAAFMVGEFHDPHDIIKRLLPLIHDPDSEVRNNAIRVIGETMHYAKLYDLDVRPFIELLSSPYETDRNKSLLVLLQAATLEKNKKQIKQIGEQKLQALVKLKQLNNKELAVAILKVL